MEPLVFHLFSLSGGITKRGIRLSVHRFSSYSNDRLTRGGTQEVVTEIHCFVANDSQQKYY